MEKISIIIPFYNEEKRIKKSINSVLNQTYENIEIILINDGSTDKSLEIIKNIKNDKLKVYSIKNHGQAYARNYGIKKASGKYIMFIDSDDYVDKTIVEKLFNNLIENKSDISICNITKEFGDLKINIKNYEDKFHNKSINLMVSHPGPVARLYRKSLFLDNGIKFLEGYYYEDLATIPLLGFYTNKISYIDESLYYYVIHDNSTMKKNKYTKKMEDIFYVINYLEKKYENKNYNEVFEFLVIEHLLYSAILRFVDFKEGIYWCNYISKYVKEKFSNWKNNYIYKTKSIKFKIICNLAFYKKYKIIKLIKKIKKI